MNIVLIGFMGSGKSTISRMLAEKLNRKKIELDDLILQKSGLSSIGEIFKARGELYFRELEHKIIKNISQKDNLIISAGGGIIMSQLNMLYLKENNLIIYLETPWQEIKKRVLQNKNNVRPLFQNPKEAQKLFELRDPLYKYYADKIIKTKNLSAEEVVKKIIKLIK